MAVEENVFDIALQGIDRMKGKGFVPTPCIDDRHLLEKINDSHSAIAVLGQCGSGKTSLLGRVFSDANRKNWLMGKDLPERRRLRLVTEPKDYPDNMADNTAAVKEIFDRISDACGKLKQALEEEKSNESEARDPEYSQMREEVIADLTRALDVKLDENGATTAIENLVKALGTKGNDYKYDIYIVLRRFERFILPKIGKGDKAARDRDKDVHAVLNNLFCQSKLPLYLVVSTDYNVEWKEILKIENSNLTEVGGQYVHAGSKLLENMEVVKLHTGEPDGITAMLRELQKNLDPDDRFFEDTTTSEFKFAMNWSGGNPGLMLSYCSAVHEIINEDGEYEELDSNALKKATGYLAAWCSHLDIREKEYLTALLDWMKGAEELTEVNRMLNDTAAPPSFFEKMKLSSRKKALEDERAELDKQVIDNEHQSAAKRLYDRGILTTDTSTYAYFIDQYRPSCFAIRQYLDKNRWQLQDNRGRGPVGG